MADFSEMQVYMLVKQFMRECTWLVVGGQPPSGTDHVPVIEIKDPGNLEKGSKGSLKPDVVAVRRRTLLVVELKPQWNGADRQKLLDFLSNQTRVDAFFEELRLRNIRNEEGQLVWDLRHDFELVGAIGYAGPLVSDEILTTLHISGSGEVSLIPPVTRGMSSAACIM
jgi:hypothetical protein